MKKLLYLLICLAVVFGVCSYRFEQNSSTRLFERSVFLDIDCTVDSSLFLPYSNAWLGSWRYDNPSLKVNGSNMMEADKYSAAFSNRNDNMWTLLHPKIISGAVTIYSPFDPYSFTANANGELRYPVKGPDEKENFLNSQYVREFQCYFLGRFAPQSDIPMSTINGDDSITKLSDGTVMYQYPPSEFLWYTDKQIMKYRVHVKLFIDQNGKEKKRVIEAIAPVIFEYYDGNLTRERELLWLDYSQLEPFLDEGYFFDKKGKPITYLKYFQNQVKAAKFTHS